MKNKSVGAFYPSAKGPTTMLGISWGRIQSLDYIFTKMCLRLEIKQRRLAYIILVWDVWCFGRL